MGLRLSGPESAAEPTGVEDIAAAVEAALDTHAAWCSISGQMPSIPCHRESATIIR